MKIRITAKCSDMFSAQLVDINGKIVGEYEGYVPDFMPGEHYGDYVQLDIDIPTGNVLNWKCPSQGQLNETFKLTKQV